MAIFNSEIVNDLIFAMNPTVNNTANYVKQIPYVEPKKNVMDAISDKVKTIIKIFKTGNTDENLSLHYAVNDLVQQIYSA